MRVTLLGTGDTTGTPAVGCDCGTCAEARRRGVERTRFSVHVATDSTALLVDFSPDFRAQFLAHDVPLPAAGVVTHIHFDHLDGLGNAFRVFDALPVYAAGTVDPATGESVADTIRRKYDYLDRVTVHDATPYEPTRMAGLDVTLVPVEHPPLASYGLRIKEPSSGATLSITGDTGYDIPADTRDALADADLLLADALVPASFCDRHPRGGRDHGPDGVPRTFGTKHMTREGALALADELDATRTRLVHVGHFYPPDEAFEEPLAVDGETFDL